MFLPYFQLDLSISSVGDVDLIFILVSLLVGLMEDQIRETSQLRITVMQIGVHNASDTQQRTQQLYSAVTQGENSLPAPTYSNNFQRLEIQADS